MFEGVVVVVSVQEVNTERRENPKRKGTLIHSHSLHIPPTGHGRA